MPISWPGWSCLRRGLSSPEPVSAPHPWPCPSLEQVGAVWAGQGWEPAGSKASGQSQACLTGRLERLQPLCRVLCSGLGQGGPCVEVWGVDQQEGAVLLTAGLVSERER